MFNRLILLLIGFGFTVIGLTFIITYLNLLTIGYTIEDYLLFILKRFECFLGFIGIILINIALYKRGDKKNDIHI